MTHGPSASSESHDFGQDPRGYYLGLWRLVMDGSWGGDSHRGQDPEPGPGSDRLTHRTQPKPRTRASRIRRERVACV